ncbi:MAG: RsmB/NOP family class I SAM-dependent RNA methyltransferase [Acutalibacteraceae bacterium]|nr:RsmB/NOP family class I SAM-dependent RNA methyltransferase [Acutalibacteraceae bacterium]
MEFFMRKISEAYSEEQVSAILNGCSSKRKTTLRINTLKADIDDVKNKLDSLRFEFSCIPFCETALIINNSDCDIRETDLYKNGEIYLQSLSSQLPPMILSPKENEDILDMCAAPGGKTSQIAAITNNKSHITACEMNFKRAERLKFNLEKQGVKNANVMVTDARRLESFFSFDKILIDALCSGSGTFILDEPKSYEGFTDTLINKCISSQAKLLDKALSLLKVGGEAVYSTCSILPQENDETVNKILKKHSCELIPIDEEIRQHLPLLPCSPKEAVCVCPTNEYEGFYVAKIKKIGK